jgi:hypothetical protein
MRRGQPTLQSQLALLHVIEKDSTPVVSDLTGTLGIDSQQLLTDELVEIEGQRNRLLMAQGKQYWKVVLNCFKNREARMCF